METIERMLVESAYNNLVYGRVDVAVERLAELLGFDTEPEVA